MSGKILREVENEVTEVLSNLIRINTTNPPGNESEAARYVGEILEEEGFKCEYFESTPGRGSVITRIKGVNRSPSLLLLSHLDVVPANPKEWSVDPFSGIVKDGFVWGRGAVDMKSMTAMEIMVMKLLKRNKVKPKGDIILAATADEEKGGRMGAGWLVQNHLEKVKADYVINEGGGLAIPIDGKNVYTIQTAEKGILWFKIKAEGTPGHGSIPTAADNAILRMGKILEKIGRYRSKITIVPTVKQFLEELAKESELARQALSVLIRKPGMADYILDKVAERDKVMAEEIRATLRMTVAPTIVHGGVKENVIPSECEAVFDCRILPGQKPSEALEELKNVLKEDVDLKKLEFEVIEANEPSESPTNTSLYKQIVSTIKEFEPTCAVAPILLTGGTDSRYFRKVGSVCYGFQPMKADLPYGEILKMVHGIDERISIENLVFGTSVLYNIVENFMCSSET
ncbi:M20/M25/M40 family metallo-hydrolase [Candidatus Bathyarchaeota archaeon]|nr:MAG: M20/M25/M40 family metallo-hydrolase [Candidatus Bathyarchaeota archaeon]